MNTHTTSPVITFTRKRSAESLPHPTLASETQPNWYEQLSEHPSELQHRVTNHSLKRDFTFSSILETGWAIRSPVTVTFEQADPWEDTDSDIRAVGAGADADCDRLAETVAVCSSTTVEHQHNSTFTTPSAVIDTRWRITTPAEYNTLITPVLQSLQTDITANSLYINTSDSNTAGHNTTVQLPVTISPEALPITIERGQPLATVLPLHESVHTHPVTIPYSTDSQFQQLQTRIEHLRNTQPRTYSAEVNTPLPEFTVHHNTNEDTDTHHPHEQTAKAREPDTDNTPPDSGDRPFLPTGTPYAFYIPDKYRDSVPAPQPAADYQHPAYTRALENTFSTTDFYSQPTLITQLSAAMQLGAMITTDRDLKVNTNTTEPGDMMLESPRVLNAYQCEPARFGTTHMHTPVTAAYIDTKISPVLQHGTSLLALPPLNHAQQYYQSFAQLLTGDWDHQKIRSLGHIPDGVDTIIERNTPVLQAIPVIRDNVITTAVITTSE